MNSFVKTTLAVVCGIILTSIISGILTMVFVGAVAAAGSSKPSIPSNAVLKIAGVTITEQSTEENPFDSFDFMSTGGFEIPKTLGIWDAVQAINKAATDPSVKYIYLKPDSIVAGQATIEEFRTALEHFRSSGKPIISVIENPTTGSMYLASVADKVYMPSYIGNTYAFRGITTQLIFVKDLLDKIGINVQLIRHGKYKSAGEMFVCNEASENNLEQNQVMVNSMWAHYAGKIAASREISVDELNAMIDSLKLCEPVDFLNNKLVDELLTKEQIKEKLADFAVVDDFKDVKMVSLDDYIEARKPAASIKAGDKLAVIYADGEIVDGKSSDQVAGDRFASIISKVRADSTVKAVVFRINSPGGSVVASEKIKTEIDLLQKDKIVIASYGNYAASGGYWISNSCDKVYSDATTLTGSIGVFGMVPDFSKVLSDKAHVNIQFVSSNKHGDFMSLTRPLDPQEYQYMQKSIESIYDAFLDNVSKGRGMTPEQVDEIAQGRVWTGDNALTIGLVDEIGSLEDAIHYAALQMGAENVDNLNIVAYPKQKSFAEQIMDIFEKSGEKDAFAMAEKFFSKPQVVARMPYQYIFN